MQEGCTSIFKADLRTCLLNRVGKDSSNKDNIRAVIKDSLNKVDTMVASNSKVVTMAVINRIIRMMSWRSWL